MRYAPVSSCGGCRAGRGVGKEGVGNNQRKSFSWGTRSRLAVQGGLVPPRSNQRLFSSFRTEGTNAASAAGAHNLIRGETHTEFSSTAILNPTADSRSLPAQFNRENLHLPLQLTNER